MLSFIVVLILDDADDLAGVIDVFLFNDINNVINSSSIDVLNGTHPPPFIATDAVVVDMITLTCIASCEVVVVQLQ